MEHTSQESGNKLMAILAYVGILALIPYLAKSSDPFVAFHAKQGIRLLLAELATWFAVMFFMPLLGFVPGAFMLIALLLNVVWLGWLVLSVLGIVNVLQNKKEPLPVIGSL
jgi:uncharacterized membrane protein